MEREILLRRGKRVDNGKWVYGNIVFTRSGSAFLLEGSFFSGESHEGDFKHGEIYGTEVIPETVGQYTGLTDKNGRKIFEGDICRIDGLLYKVEFKHAAWRFSVLSNNFHCYPAFCSHCDICEVIGNVFDNSELLKGE